MQRLLFILFIAFAFQGRAQELTLQEKRVLEVINEFRSDPQGFLEDKIMPYIRENNLTNNRYARSLIRDIKKLAPLPQFSIDSSLQEMAQEFAIKSGKRGWFGHHYYSQRFNEYGAHLAVDAENIQYGYADPESIVIDLLIDEDVPSLGHRKNLMDKAYTVLGIGFAPHKSYDHVTVMAFGGY